MRGVSCSLKDDLKYLENNAKISTNELFNGGCKKFSDGTGCWVFSQEWSQNVSKVAGSLEGHCRESSADMVFMFLAAALLLVTAGLAFLRKRKGY